MGLSFTSDGEVTPILDRKQTLEYFMKEYGRLVFTVCYSMTGDYFQSEDLAQETFVSAYRHLDSFDGKNEKAWLTKIASNKCRDFLKSAANNRVKPADDEVFAVIPSAGQTPEEELLSADVKDRMAAFCGRLKEPYRSISVAYFLKEESPQEIADRTGKNIKTVQTQIYRAKAMLKKIWKEESA